jgi:hypothetical protein
MRRFLTATVALLLAAVLWVPCLHLFFRSELDLYRLREGIPSQARKLAATHLVLWSDPHLLQQELTRMRRNNPEWDFMSRTYFVLALANMGLRDPAFASEACRIIDAIIADTLSVESSTGFRQFLMPYGQAGSWKVSPPRSIFVDGEIALMMGARRMVAEESSYIPPMQARVSAMIAQMRQSPVLCGESYPDECWLFCNTVALAAIRLHDVLDGADHHSILAAWVDTARSRLLDPGTGLLISAFAVDGTPAECGFSPEGSTIWMASHMLQVVDPAFARDQYQRAREKLGRIWFGFGYSREWPAGVEAAMDIDSGPVVPLWEASASASGLAILAACAFEDHAYARALFTSLELAGFPQEQEGRLRYLAGFPRRRLPDHVRRSRAVGADLPAGGPVAATGAGHGMDEGLSPRRPHPCALTSSGWRP